MYINSENKIERLLAILPVDYLPSVEKVLVPSLPPRKSSNIVFYYEDHVRYFPSGKSQTDSYCI